MSHGSRGQIRIGWLVRTMSVLLAVVLVFGGLAAWPQPVSAWKPDTHEHLSEEVRLDAIADGRVAIYNVDYAAGTVGTKLGDYEVDPNILKALRACPNQYRAGVVGADFVPDIAISQLLVHPDTRSLNNATSNTWLQRIWNRASQETLPASMNPSSCTPPLAKKAFAVGMLVHAAGDMYGHSYINEFAGGSWQFDFNAARHMLLESYLDRRTSDDSLGFYNISITGVEDMIYDEMLGPNNIGGVANLLAQGDLPVEDYTFGRLFGGIRLLLTNRINTYNTAITNYTNHRNQHLDAASACAYWDPRCFASWEYSEAAAVLVEQTAYITAWYLPIQYMRAWRNDIDSGLRAWPAVSFAAHRSILFDQPLTYYQSVDDILEPWVTDHLIGMIGFPDFVGDIVGLDIVKMVLPDKVITVLNAMKAGLYNWLWRTALGEQIEEWKLYLTSPELYFDQVPILFPYNNACWMTLREFNGSELNLADTGYMDAAETYDYREFRPAYNTMTMIKLSLLSRAGLTALMRDLGSTANVAYVQMPLILGYINSLDQSNQGLRPVNQYAPSMLLAREPAIYEKVFVQQRGVQLTDEAQMVPCVYRDHESGQDDDSDGDTDDGTNDGQTGDYANLTSFRSNGSQISGWYWLRDSGLSHYAEYEFGDIPSGTGDITLEFYVLATNRSGGGRGFDATFRLVYGVPGSDALVSVPTTISNTSPSSDTLGYGCTGTVVIPRSALGGGSRLFIRIERVAATDNHVAFNAESIRLRTGTQ
ncbi:MAG: hypothetical protein ACYCZF_03480 [Anaerolineae bacterium]